MSIKTVCKKCGACCTAPSISSPIPGMEHGKPAGITCIHLSVNNTCGIYSQRPAVCRDYTPTIELCGSSYNEAIANLSHLENLTTFLR